MTDNNSIFIIEHRLELLAQCKAVQRRMIEIPEGDVILCGNVFHVGAFKIAASPVTVSSWKKVMGLERSISRSPVRVDTYSDVSCYVRRLDRVWKGAGRFSIPTEAQLERARKTGAIRCWASCGEVCLSEFKRAEEMAGHHFVENIPRVAPADMVIRYGEERASERSDRFFGKDIGFRLVLVGLDVPEPDFKEVMAQIEQRGKQA